MDARGAVTAVPKELDTSATALATGSVVLPGGLLLNPGVT